MIGNDNNNITICSKMIKADYTGANIYVYNAKNEKLIGVGGLVVKETSRCFIVI